MLKLIIKKTVKKSAFLNRGAYIFYRLIYAINEIDFQPLKEFGVWKAKGQDLSANNYRFYKNFIDRCISSSTKNTHFIDIGANDGWFLKVINRFSKDARITSYEPLLSQHQALDQLKTKYKNLDVKKVAVGDKEGTLVINEYGTTGLSSLKKIKGQYDGQRFDQSLKVSHPVKVVILDNEMDNIINSEVNETINTEYVLKVDTQGFEYEVLLGAQKSLQTGVFKYIILELVTEEKYENGHSYDFLFDYLHKFGYKLWDLNNTLYDSNTGKLSEFDAIFSLEGKEV